MSYLQPPPNMSPVVVVKDFGGYVNEYAAQTEIYRRSGREVRIHECHSACTMALGLPNVCVYRDSVFKFHQAYNPNNHVTNWQVTDELYLTYPEAVRTRLGTPTKGFTVLRGAELIDLGVRDCNGPTEPRIMLAQARLRPIPDSILSGNGNGGGSAWSTLTGKLGGIIPNLGSKPEPRAEPDAGSGKRPAPAALPAELLAPKVPLPPERPAAPPDATDTRQEPAGTPDTLTTPGSVPVPVPRPKIIVAYVPSLPPIPFMQRIEGSQPILPARFVPFPGKPT